MFTFYVPNAMTCSCLMLWSERENFLRHQREIVTTTMARRKNRRKKSSKEDKNDIIIQDTCLW